MFGFTDSIPPEGHRLSVKEGQEKIERMPTAFLDIDDVCCHWRLIYSRASNFIRQVFSLQRGHIKLSEIHAGMAVLGPPMISSTHPTASKFFEVKRRSMRKSISGGAWLSSHCTTVSQRPLTKARQSQHTLSLFVAKLAK
jgi:hypothetical protein